MSPLQIKKNIFDSNKIPYPFKKKKIEYNLYEVQTAKCTKTLYITDTIRPVV